VSILLIAMLGAVLTDQRSKLARPSASHATSHHCPIVAELVDLRWDQIDFDSATLAVRRVKKGTPSTHPLRGDELRARVSAMPI
jgi:integrase